MAGSSNSTANSSASTVAACSGTTAKKMDTVASSRRNPCMQKGNKENAEPAGSKLSLKVNKPGTISTAPLKQKSNEKEETQAKEKAFQKVKPKMTKAVHHYNRAAGDNRQSISQAFRTAEAVKHRKLVEATKPPTVVPRSAPGMYKGKVVQSKIGAIWKSSGAITETAVRSSVKPSATKAESHRVGHLTKTRSKSIADLPGNGEMKLQPSRSKSVSDELPPVPRRLVAGRPPVRPTHPPPSSRTTVAPKGKGTRVSKAMAPAVIDGVKKHPVCSTLSQYRVSTETAEERRAKLAEWLASKGKSLKRPAMAVPAAAPKTTANPDVRPKCQVKSQVDPELAVQREPEREPEHSLAHHGPGSAACEGPAAEATRDLTPQIMNTTLDLLDNSDMDLPVDPEPKINDIVVNLCEALAALETTSACGDEPLPKTVKSDLEEEEDEAEEELDEDYEKDLVGQASVVKYSVKTTPYLQSVRKTINGEAGACGSLRKSGIKDLKFLTPVRRSCRIQRQSSRLPGMLADHDTCVSSLAELVKMDDDLNAYIYRKNPALLEDLPDQHQYS